MKKIICSILFLCISVSAILAQNGFSLQYASAPVVDNSLYKTIGFLDSRPDYEYNSIKINGENFSEKLNYFIENTINESAKEGELLFQLRNLTIQKSGNSYQAQLRANLYNKQGNNYYLVNLINADMKAMSVSGLQIALSDQILSFVDANLTETYAINEPYTLDDIYNFDLVDKNKMEAYRNEALTDGIYINYKDFKDQYPLDDRLEVSYNKDGQLREVMAINVVIGKSLKISPKDVYAIVLGGQAYISFDNKFIPVCRYDTDFFFQYKALKGLNKSFLPVINITSLGNINESNQNIIYKIDHLNGDILPVGRR